MRIIQVIRSLTFGGAENHVLSLLLELRERGHDVLLAAPEKSWIGDQCRLHQLSIVDISMRGVTDVFSYWKLHQLIRSWRADIVHAHQVRPAQYTGLATKTTKAIPICTAHSTGVSKHMRQCHHIIAVSDAVVQNLVRHHYSRDIITRIYNGVPDFIHRDHTLVRSELKIPEEQFAVVCAGRFHWDKGQDILVKVLQLCPSDIHLYLIGDYQTPFGKEVLKLAEGAANIHFLGYRDDVRQILSAFDVYIAPSRREAFSLSLAEAQAAGLPIVGSNIGGIPEVVSNNESGILVASEDIEAFAGAIQRLYVDSVLRKKMGKNGRLRYEQNFTLDRMVSETESLYRNLLNIV